MSISLRRHRRLVTRAAVRRATLETRKLRLELQVARGIRSAGTLVLIPKDLVLRATLTFPSNAFGEPQPWGEGEIGGDEED